MTVSRWLYMGVGWLCFGIGAVGVVVPGLPTTPFMLLALGAFARGSPRLERWLLAHRRFGPALVAWRAHRVVPRRARYLAWGSSAASLIYLIGWSHAPTWSLPVIAAAMAYGAWYVARCPSELPRGAPVPAQA